MRWHVRTPVLSSKIATIILVVTLALLLDEVFAFGGNNFQWYCDLRGDAVVELLWSSAQRSYVILNRNNDSQTAGSKIASDVEEDPSTRRRILSIFRKEDKEIISKKHFDYRVSSYLSRGLKPDYYEYEKAFSVPRKAQEDNTKSGNHMARSPIFYSNSDESYEDEDIILARSCTCWDAVGNQDKAFFCPVSGTHCAIAASSGEYNDRSEWSSSVYSEDPRCINIDRSVTFARNIWPIIICWYLAILLCLLITRPGGHAVGYCISRCCCSLWNVWAANRVLRRGNSVPINRGLFFGGLNDDRWGTTQHRFTIELSSSSLEHHGGRLILRTKNFHIDQQNGREERASNNRYDEDNDIASVSTTQSISNIPCMICHADIQDGDRVGNLPCHHIMHVDCLKAWIVRRNVCPICLAENIATPNRINPEESNDDDDASVADDRDTGIVQDDSNTWMA